MKFTRKALAFSVMAATASMSAHAIQMDTDYAGQLLLAPVYAAGPNQTTEIRVVNPSNEIAVKAHVAFRSAKSSYDVLDFLVYLSPGDEWIGTVQYDAAQGKPVLVSTDDSMLYSYNDSNNSTQGTPLTAVWGTPATGVPFFTERENANLGHIEILGVYAVYDGVGATAQNTTAGNGTADLIFRTMKKDVLFNIDNNVYGGGNFIVNTVPKQGLYDGYVPAVTPVANLGHANCFAAKGGDPAPNAFFMTSDVDKTNGKNTAVAGTPNFTENYCIDTTDNRIQLFGEVTIKLNANAAPFSYKMAALDDSNGVGVIENPYFDVVAENDVPLGVRMGALVAGVATDNINLIEAAISVDGSTFVGTYDSLTSMVGGDANAPTGVAESLSVVTLPTKYRHVTDSTPDINHVTDDATKKDTYYETSPFTNVPFVTRHASTMGLLADFDGVPAANALQIVTNAKEFDDNGRSEDGSSRDVLKYESTYVHYDYDYGFKEALMVAIDGFAPGGAAPRPNHWPAPASDFIYGQYNDACTSVVASGKTANRPFNSTYGNTLPATYTRTTYDLEENRYTVAATQNTGVISGGIGDGTTVSNAFLPQEVNILTDDDMSWYSTKGWYQLSVNGTCHVDNGVGVGGVANDQVVNGTESEYSVPAFILTVTTDGQGNSRVVPATRFAD